MIIKNGIQVTVPEYEKKEGRLTYYDRHFLILDHTFFMGDIYYKTREIESGSADETGTICYLQQEEIEIEEGFYPDEPESEEESSDPLTEEAVPEDILFHVVFYPPLLKTLRFLFENI